MQMNARFFPPHAGFRVENRQGRPGALVGDPAAAEDRIENKGRDLKLRFLLTGFEFSREMLRQCVLRDPNLGRDVIFRCAAFSQRAYLDALLRGRFECRAWHLFDDALCAHQDR